MSLVDCPFCSTNGTEPLAEWDVEGEEYVVVRDGKRLMAFRLRHGDVDMEGERDLTMLLYEVADDEWGEDTWELEPESTPHGWVYYARRKT